MAQTTITDQFKINTLEQILNSWADSDQYYYIGIGKSEEWNDSDSPIAITNTLSNELSFRGGLQGIKTIENISYVVPRVDWSSGTIYSAYDNTVVGHPVIPYYVMTAENDVYVCLEQGKNIVGSAVTSVIKPTSKSFDPFKTSDGYVWKYLYTVDLDSSEKFLSGNFMPVKHLTELTGEYSNEDSDQFDVQNNSTDGLITSLSVTDAGSGYTSAPTVTIAGDGTGAAAVANISNGSIVSLEIDSDGSGNLLHGSGYSYANVSITGNGTARVNIGPRGGIGSNPIKDLKARGLMFNTKLVGVENGSLLVNQDFRQVGIIRNPKVPGTSTKYTDTSGSALTYVEYSNLQGTFSADSLIEGQTSGTRAIVDSFSSSNNRIYFHQNETSGYGDFTTGEIIQQVGNSSIIANVDTINNGDIDPLSGDVLYMENRSAVDRSEEQTEDIKIIIQL